MYHRMSCSLATELADSAIAPSLLALLAARASHDMIQSGVQSVIRVSSHFGHGAVAFEPVQLQVSAGFAAREIVMSCSVS